MLMRKLAAKQLERLRGIAVMSLEAAPSAPPVRFDFGVAPEDLVVACDRALGWDEMAEEDEGDKHALVETSHQRCAAAWKCRHGKSCLG
jgi:hypothetical protein